MKMTIEIPKDVLAEVMLLTGQQTKRDAVEHALRETARRAKQHRIWSQGLGLTPAQIDAEAAPHPSDALDTPDIDQDAVNRFLAGAEQRRLRQAQREAQSGVNEPSAPYHDLPQD
jgi:hypothetical protein